MIVDAGGTIDASSYSRNTTVVNKEFFDENAAPQYQCVSNIVHPSPDLTFV